MGSESIACIVLNWNSGQNAMNCVRSLLASQGVNTDILVVDNGSTDGSDVVLRDTFPGLALLKNDQNFGVAKAWNAGVRWAMDRGSGYVFFLNDDAVVDPGCLAALLHTIGADPQTGIVSPRILDGKNSGRVWFDGGFTNVFGDTVHRDRAACPAPQREPFAEDFSTGCAMLVRAEVFKQAGLFDESYFAYSEDADLCFRSSAQGFAVIHNPRALVTHYPSTATIKNKGKWFRDYYVARNRLLLMGKHLHGWRWILFLLYFAFKHLVVPVLYFGLTGQFKRISAVVAGVGDFLGNRFGERYA